MKKIPWLVLLATSILIFVKSSSASMGIDPGGSDHAHAVVPVLLELVIILLAAKIGGDIAVRLKQPEVLGELVMGLMLGNLALVGANYFGAIKDDQIINIFSELGVILLLFEVGLETNLSEMLKVGLSSFMVALLGVIAPFFLGWAVSAYFVPQAETLVHIFVGATLTATSVGITARVLKDLGKTKTPESQIILGAAVIDDILGLLVLAVVTAAVAASNSGESLDFSKTIKIIGMASGFMGGAIIMGRYLSPYYFKIASYLQSHGILLISSLVVCFSLAYLANVVGLAPIVGAFTAGLILDPLHYKDLSSRKGNEIGLEEMLRPITTIFVPIFFVIMGAKVDLRVFGNLEILGYALALTSVAILGKQLCSLGVLEKKLDRFVVGLGMIPRGEVGLIFAGIGVTLKLHDKAVIDSATFGAIVIMVILTTMLAPPLLKWRLLKKHL